MTEPGRGAPKLSHMRPALAVMLPFALLLSAALMADGRVGA
jgi:hypothetical protein